MGHFQNKIPRMERHARMMDRMREQLARDAERAAANPLPRCRCGLTWHDTQLFALHGRWGDPVRFACLVCWPNDVEKPVSLQP